jgi:hypothetical protein
LETYTDPGTFPNLLGSTDSAMGMVLSKIPKRRKGFVLPTNMGRVKRVVKEIRNGTRNPVGAVFGSGRRPASFLRGGKAVLPWRERE